MTDDELITTAADGDRVVALVGAGVVNIVTALALSDAGHRVVLLDAAPDPRADRPWQEYGCTRAGGAARMVTVTEADQYSGLVPAGNPGGVVFDTPPEQGGWDVRGSAPRSVHDQEWIREYSGLPTWRADRYRAGVHNLNRAAEAGWERILRAHPRLAGATGLRRGIQRAYSTTAAFDRAVERHRAVGDLLDVYSPAELAERAPALSRALPGRLGGGIAVRGFTLDVHRFLTESLAVLEGRGARLYFGTEVTGIATGPGGAVEGVVVRGRTLPVDDLVVSPGAHGHRILADLGLGGRIAGVLGIWHVLPDVYDQRHSLKISRPGRIAEDANITVGSHDGAPALIVGSGYGFTGTGAMDVDIDRLALVQGSVDEMMRELLPDAYEAAGGPAWLREAPRYCVRPWTATSLGLYSVRPTRTGRCIVTGGHNTGGFTQAPEVAEAVLASLHGRSHPMHHLYRATTTHDVPAAYALGGR